MDFVVEVIRSKYLLFDNLLSESDYIQFINTKSHFHKEIEELSVSTAKKVKQKTFTLLQQVGLITHFTNGTILKPIITNEVVDVIVDDEPSFLAVFLYSNRDIKSVQQKLKNA